MKTSRRPEFEKDLKKLLKRFPTLNEDLTVLVNVQLSLFHVHGIDNKGIFRIPDLGISSPKFFKVKKFACKSLKGRGVHSGIRIIYAYYPESKYIELIEIYYKSDQENEDRKRILDIYGTRALSLSLEN